MKEKILLLIMIAMIGGTFVGAWVWGVASGNHWPIIVWFAVAVAIAATGG